MHSQANGPHVQTRAPICAQTRSLSRPCYKAFLPFTCSCLCEPRQAQEVVTCLVELRFDGCTVAPSDFLIAKFGVFTTCAAASRICSAPLLSVLALALPIFIRYSWHLGTHLYLPGVGTFQAMYLMWIHLSFFYQLTGAAQCRTSGALSHVCKNVWPSALRTPQMSLF